MDNSTQQQSLTTSIWYPRVASSWVNGGNPFTSNVPVTGEVDGVSLESNDQRQAELRRQIESFHVILKEYFRGDI